MLRTQRRSTLFPYTTLFRSTLRLNGGTVIFDKDVLVSASATLSVETSQSLQLNVVLTNLGTIRLPSQQVNSDVSGTGPIENLGLIEIYDLNPSAHNGGEVFF